MLSDFYKNYEIRLARALSRVEKRGMLMDANALENLRAEITSAINKELTEIAHCANCPTVLSAAEAKGKPKETIIINSTKQTTALIESQGIKLRKSRTTGKTASDSATLHIALAESGSPIIHSLLKIRELGKLRSVYVDAPLLDNTLYGSFRATGTDTGRRSSSANVFGLGTNLQNLPKWSNWAKRYRSCIIARPGKILIQCDQRTAEDWVINAIIADVSGDTKGIDELRTKINRHIKLAGFVFGLPEAEISKESIQYALAKRVRYAGSYGMWKWTMAETLASEGKIVHPDECAVLLDRFHLAEPSIRSVFQRWIEEQLRNARCLSTPLGRYRQFFDLRSYSNNSAIFRKAYAFIPQSSVGDNTGMAIVHIEDHSEILLGESHDSVITEVDDNEEAIEKAGALIRESFDRELTFPINGFKIKIPIETEFGYSLGNLQQCDLSNKAGWIPIWQELHQQMKHQQNSIYGVPQPS
jgi:DNA polymerase I